MDGKTETLLKIRDAEEKARQLLEKARQEAEKVGREAREKALELERQAVEEALEEQRAALANARRKLEGVADAGEARKLRERAEKRLGRAVQLAWKELEAG